MQVNRMNELCYKNWRSPASYVLFCKYLFEYSPSVTYCLQRILELWCFHSVTQKFKIKALTSELILSLFCVSSADFFLPQSNILTTQMANLHDFQPPLLPAKFLCYMLNSAFIIALKHNHFIFRYVLESKQLIIFSCK